MSQNESSPRYLNRGSRCELTVQTQILKVAVAEVVLHDRHERGHLAEEQDSVVCGLQLRQDAIKKFKLARSSIQVIPGGIYRVKHTIH